MPEDEPIEAQQRHQGHVWGSDAPSILLANPGHVVRVAGVAGVAEAAGVAAVDVEVKIVGGAEVVGEEGL